MTEVLAIAEVVLAMTEVQAMALATIPMMVLASSGSDGCTGTNDSDEGIGYNSGHDGGISMATERNYLNLNDL